MSSLPPIAPLPPPREPGGPYRICFVCLGNICRSPMAEWVLHSYVTESGVKVQVDSAGTGDWHIGQAMNTKALTQLTRRGHGGDSHRSRQIDASWLAERDLFLAMDSSNLADLHRMAEAIPGAKDRIRLFGEVGGLGGADIPDPYGGSATDFAKVLDMLEAAAPHILAAVDDLY